MKIIIFNCLFLLGACLSSVGQTIDETHITYAHAKASLDVLKTLIAIPNDAHFPEDIEKNIQWCEKQLAAYAFTTKRLPTPSVPLLLASSQQNTPNRPMVLLYIHIDGQPVDPSFWHQADPYKAVLKEKNADGTWEETPWERLQEEKLDPEWRIFGRSSSDDKAPLAMIFAVMETMKAQKESFPYNVKIILDFEEEIGSPNLAKAVTKAKADLASDMLLILMGQNTPQIYPQLPLDAGELQR